MAIPWANDLTFFEMLTALASLAALIGLGYFMWDRYRPHRHRLDVDAKQTLFATLESPGQAHHGRLGLVFYVMSITNVSSAPFTVKYVLLRYTVGDTTFEDESHFIQTGVVTPKETKEAIPSAILRVGKDSIVLMGWRNMREVIAQRKTIDPGGVLSGSAYFPLPIAERDEVSKLKDIQIVVTDFQGRKSIYHLTILDDWLKLHPNAILLNRSFKADGEGAFTFA